MTDYTEFKVPLVTELAAYPSTEYLHLAKLLRRRLPYELSTLLLHLCQLSRYDKSGYYGRFLNTSLDSIIFGFKITMSDDGWPKYWPSIPDNPSSVASFLGIKDFYIVWNSEEAVVINRTNLFPSFSPRERLNGFNVLRRLNVEWRGNPNPSSVPNRFPCSVRDFKLFLKTFKNEDVVRQCGRSPTSLLSVEFLRLAQNANFDDLTGETLRSLYLYTNGRGMVSVCKDTRANLLQTMSELRSADISVTLPKSYMTYIFDKFKGQLIVRERSGCASHSRGDIICGFYSLVLESFILGLYSMIIGGNKHLLGPCRHISICELIMFRCRSSVHDELSLLANILYGIHVSRRQIVRICMMSYLRSILNLTARKFRISYWFTDSRKSINHAAHTRLESRANMYHSVREVCNSRCYTVWCLLINRFPDQMVRCFQDIQPRCRVFPRMESGLEDHVDQLSANESTATIRAPVGQFKTSELFDSDDTRTRNLVRSLNAICLKTTYDLRRLCFSPSFSDAYIYQFGGLGPFVRDPPHPRMLPGMPPVMMHVPNSVMDKLRDRVHVTIYCLSVLPFKSIVAQIGLKLCSLMDYVNYEIIADPMQLAKPNSIVS
jgi:hypothetical protein